LLIAFPILFSISERVLANLSDTGLKNMPQKEIVLVLRKPKKPQSLAKKSDCKGGRYLGFGLHSCHLVAN